ncbi:MAG: serine protease [Acidobacteriota bacterium]
MKKELTAAIMVKVGEETILSGTGYPIAPDLVLTCWHVVHPEGQDELGVSTVVIPGKGLERTVVEEAWGDRKLDVSILRLNEALDMPWEHASQVLGWTPPEQHARWETAGFPRFTITPSRGIGGLKAEPFAGRAHSVAEGDDTLHLGVDESPEQEVGWKGLSGGPVFVDGRLVGVLREYRSDFATNNRIVATPIVALRDRDGISSVLGLDAWEKRLGEHGEAIRRHLREHPALLKLLSEELDVDDGVDAIIKALLHTRGPELVDLLDAVDESCPSDDPGTQRPARGLAELVLPACVDVRAAFHALDQAFEQSEGAGAGPIALPVSSDAFAEAAMAGVDGRPCAFVLSEDEIVGLGRVPPSPEAGFDLQGQGKLDAVIEHLSQKLRRKHASRDKLVALLKGALKSVLSRARRQAKGKRRSPYYLLLHDDGGGETTQFGQRVHQELGFLRVIQVSDDLKLMQYEAEVTQPLRDILERDDSVERVSLDDRNDQQPEASP